MSGVWQQGREELLHELRELESRQRRDYAAGLALIAELDQRSAAAGCGYPSLGELLRDVLRIPVREARRRIGHAHAITAVPAVSGGTVPAQLPATAAAAGDGLLGADHIEVIGRALTGLPLHVGPEAIASAEQTMVTAAASMDAQTLGRVGTRVRAILDQDGAPPREDELATPVNELQLTTRANGRTAFRGELEPEASALLRSLLSPLAKPRPSSANGPDPRSSAERQGDALADLLHLAASTGGVPAEAGEPPHLLVTVPLHALQSGIGSVQLDHAGDLDAAAARRIACDCAVIPVVLGARSEPLDVGRSSYVVPAALRRALVLRDGGCVFPGCDRPQAWCHSHHIRHWADGGDTALDNLVLLCGHHHRLLHHSAWECAVVDGVPEFTPPRFVDPARTARRKPVHLVIISGDERCSRCVLLPLSPAARRAVR